MYTEPTALDRFVAYARWGRGPQPPAPAELIRRLVDRVAKITVEATDEAPDSLHACPTATQSQLDNLSDIELLNFLAEQAASPIAEQLGGRPFPAECAVAMHRDPYTSKPYVLFYITAPGPGDVAAVNTTGTDDTPLALPDMAVLHARLVKTIAEHPWGEGFRSTGRTTGMAWVNGLAEAVLTGALSMARKDFILMPDEPTKIMRAAARTALAERRKRKDADVMIDAVWDAFRANLPEK